MKVAEGIRKLHSARCSARHGGKCGCRGGYEASVFSPRDRRKIRKTFPTIAAAKTWRADAIAAVQRGSLRAPRPTTVIEAAEQLLEGMQRGTIRTRSGDVYKPSAIRSYAAALRLHVLPELGGRKLTDVQRRDVQRLADELLASGRDPSTIRNALMPLRVIYRRAIEDGDVAVNPCSNLRLPANRGKRDRVATPEEATTLLAALPPGDRALWALALMPACGEERSWRCAGRTSTSRPASSASSDLGMRRRAWSSRRRAAQAVAAFPSLAFLGTSS